MTEVPKRLSPTIEVLRELYLKSGNQCAFPGCNHLLMNKDGVFIAQICHIEAAEPGGQRFNKDQTNEQRRAFENLLLLCHEHHKVTDDEARYTVAALKQMKRQHEMKFSDIAHVIQQSITDKSMINSGAIPTNIKKLDQVLDWNHNDDDLEETFKELVPFLENLRKLPIPTRQLLVVIVSRSDDNQTPWYKVNVPVQEIIAACDLSPQDFWGQYAILERYGLASEGDPGDIGVPHLELNNLNSGWPIWHDLKKFSLLTGVPLHTIIVDQKFEVLAVKP